MNVSTEFDSEWEDWSKEQTDELDTLESISFDASIQQTVASALKSAAQAAERLKAADDAERLREQNHDIKVQLERAPEAAFTKWSDDALRRDAGLKGFEPKENRDEHGRLVSTTYKLKELGITERALPPNNGDEMKPFIRVVEITVPTGATHLGQCDIKFEERKEISKDLFVSEMKDMQARHAKLSGSSKVCTYTHGILTSSDANDVQSLALELTSGHPVISMDWASLRKPLSHDGASRFNLKVLEEKNALYAKEIASSEKSKSKLGDWFGTVEAAVGARNMQIIGFSHGADVNRGALLDDHGKNRNSPVDRYLEVHPDVKETELSRAKYEVLGRRAYVIGSQQDRALQAAADLTEPTRLGRNSAEIRSRIEANGGVPITDPPRRDGKEQVHNDHYINYVGVAELLNQDQKVDGSWRSNADVQNQILEATKKVRGERKAELLALPLKRSAVK